jgi:NarL family two-component system response regulator LiaR
MATGCMSSRKTPSNSGLVGAGSVGGRERTDGEGDTVRGPIEIVLVDHQQTLAEALRLFLENEEDLALIGVSQNGDTGLHLFRGGKQQVLMLDLSSRSNLAEALEEECQGALGDGVVALSAADHAETMRAASHLDEEVRVVEAHSSEQLAGELRRFVSGGGMFVSYTQPTPEYRRDPGIELLVRTLSRRERDILELITAGYSNQRIAQLRFLSMHTVRTHIQSILVKLGVHSKLEAAVFAVQHRLVPLEEDRAGDQDQQPTSASTGR